MNAVHIVVAAINQQKALRDFEIYDFVSSFQL